MKYSSKTNKKQPKRQMERDGMRSNPILANQLLEQLWDERDKMIEEQKQEVADATRRLNQEYHATIITLTKSQKEMKLIDFDPSGKILGDCIQFLQLQQQMIEQARNDPSVTTSIAATTTGAILPAASLTYQSKTPAPLTRFGLPIETPLTVRRDCLLYSENGSPLDAVNKSGLTVMLSDNVNNDTGIKPIEVHLGGGKYLSLTGAPEDLDAWQSLDADQVEVAVKKLQMIRNLQQMTAVTDRIIASILPQLTENNAI